MNSASCQTEWDLAISSCNYPLRCACAHLMTTYMHIHVCTEPSSFSLFLPFFLALRHALQSAPWEGQQDPGGSGPAAARQWEGGAGGAEPASAGSQSLPRQPHPGGRFVSCSFSPILPSFLLLGYFPANTYQGMYVYM